MGWEPFSLVVRTARPLLERHWREIALNQDKVPLDPDWDRYYKMEAANCLWVWTVRAHGTLIGYAVYIVSPGLHYVSTNWAITDIFWIAPEYREGWTGIRLFKDSFRALKAIGVKVVHVRVKDTFATGEDGRGRVGRFLTRVLKMRPIETVYELVIGD